MRQQIQIEVEDSCPDYRLRVQPCPVCQKPIGDMPGSRDAVCHNCGYKDPCCE